MSTELLIILTLIAMRQRFDELRRILKVRLSKQIRCFGKQNGFMCMNHTYLTRKSFKLNVKLAHQHM